MKAMHSRQPTPDEVKAFLQGYREASREAATAAEEALKTRKNVRQTVAEKMRSGYAAWTLRFEKAGCVPDDGTRMPDRDDVWAACILSAGIIVIIIAVLWPHHAGV
jgi:hypothetical protein